LKAAYLKVLGAGDPRVRVIRLTGDPRLLRERLERRAGHFAGAGLLESQLEAQEGPKGALVVDVADPPERIVDEIMASLSGPRTPARRSP
jgi:gluconokinase